LKIDIYQKLLYKGFGKYSKIMAQSNMRMFKKSAKNYIQNGGQKPRWRLLKNKSNKILIETLPSELLRNNFLTPI
jgi:hypothetical protein